MDDTRDHKTRLKDLEIQMQMLMMATPGVGPSTGGHHLGRVMISIGMSAQEYLGYYRFLNEVTTMSVAEIWTSFNQHLPNRRPEHLLELGIANYLDSGSRNARFFMEAAPRRIREEDPDPDQAQGR